MGIDLDLRRLRYFVEVVRQGGFSQAAKVVFASQPTVSKAVKQLEDELGVPLLVLMPRQHPFAEQRSVKLAKLAGSPLILFEEGFALNDLILEAFRKKGVSPKVAARSSQVDFIFELVAAGSGIAFLPRAVAEQRAHRSVRLALLDEPKCKWSTALAWRRGGHLSHAARAWLAHAQEKRVS